MKRILAICLLCVLVPANVYAGKKVNVIKGHTVAEAPSDKAMVYFVRPAVMGTAIIFWIFVDDKAVGVTRGKTYSYAHVEPGKHIIWSKGENVSAVKMDVEPGKTYYFKHEVKMGGLKARVDLVPLSRSEGQAYLAKLKYAQPTEQGLERAREHSEKSYGKAKEEAQ